MSVVAPAARLPGEDDWLTAIVTAPADESVKLVYADWLEEQGDPRGPFLRQFVDATRENRACAVPDWVSYGWLELMGFNLVAVIRDAGLAEHRAAILARAKPAVAIQVELTEEKLIPVGASKFGGLPSLPLGAVWPRTAAGHPLEFLAQFDLAELQKTVAGRALPPGGLLSFFMYHNYPWDAYGGPHTRGTTGGLQIIHTPAGTDLRLVSAPEDLTEDLGRPHTPAQLLFVDVLDLPDTHESWPPVEGSLRTPVLEGNHQLFGYAHVTVLAEDPIPGPEWEHLIRFDSDSQLQWGWGDGHRLFWYIKSADLKSGQFDNTVAFDG